MLKRAEDALQLIFRNADPCVFDVQQQIDRVSVAVGILTPNAEPHVSFCRELHAVADEVDEHLTYARFVQDQRVWNVVVDIDQEVDSLLLGLLAVDRLEFHR